MANKTLKVSPNSSSMAAMMPAVQQHHNTPTKGMIVGAVAYGNQQQSNGNVMPSQTDATTQPLLPSHNGRGIIAGGGGAGMVLNGASEQMSNSPLANTKEKTPMCLINELARYNKIQHQYTLVDETGPAHKKTFFVKLKLGEEEYDSSGASIKKAQHSAAETALQKTTYKHPPPKPPRAYNQNLYVSANNITPTVELNAIAMKRGEPAVYQTIEPHRPQYYPPPNYDYRGMYNQRYHYPRLPRVFYVSLKVGQREFIGEGPTRQAARHCAADKALKILIALPVPPDENLTKSEDEPTLQTSAAVAVTTMTEEERNDELKSEISLVHEIALKRKLSVNFEVISETGPPHMRTFRTRCLVGDIARDGDGNGKKISKKRAAEKMLEELRKLPPLPPAMVPTRPKPRPPLPGNKKKNRNLIKMQKADPGYGVGINPISRLIQIQQAKKEREPVYTLVEERGLPRRREFVMQVTVGVNVAPGIGPNKKLAKRNAAEAMLQLLGYSRPSPQPTKPAIKTSNGNEASGDKKVTFVETETAMAAGRQLVPGVLLMPDAVRSSNHHGNINLLKPGVYQVGDVMVSAQTTSLIAKELLDHGRSPTVEALRKADNKRVLAQSLVRPKQQLNYLAEILGFQVQFTDFPKGNNKNEYLSLVSLSTNPPQVSHGAGPTTEASHDAAALTALKALSEMALGVDKTGAGDAGPSSMKVNATVDKN
ncbi:double-stranded RNA-binding protein Staufen homolog [Tubulanus polymorphus]|uniref:double-stranded RNA-binding protein Staufen homolog n=1 Tax=Tubulanus polymorphus TaxID=672921 RepID=UPI003DA667EA